MSDRTDQELVRRVQEGDRAAFDLLFSRYQHKILNLVSRFVKDSAEVEDVTQEAFIKAFRAIPRFRGDSAFYTWLYRIAINTAKNHLVSRGRRPPSVDIDAEDAEYMESAEPLRLTDDPLGEIAQDDLKRAIDDVLTGLPDDLRSAVTLREFDGLSYEQIAVILECPVGTVRSRIFRAREAIDARIRPLIAGEAVGVDGTANESRSAASKETERAAVAKLTGGSAGETNPRDRIRQSGLSGKRGDEDDG